MTQGQTKAPRQKVRAAGWSTLLLARERCGQGLLSSRGTANTPLHMADIQQGPRWGHSGTFMLAGIQGAASVL